MKASPTTYNANSWTPNIRAYNPSKDLKHLDNTDEYSGFSVDSKDVSKSQGFVTFASKMAKKLISSGFNILNLTLPAVMLTEKSAAEIQLYGFANLSLFASQAAKETDPLQRMRLVQAGAISGISLVVQIMQGNPPYPNFVGGTLIVSLFYWKFNF